MISRQLLINMYVVMRLDVGVLIVAEVMHGRDDLLSYHDRTSLQIGVVSGVAKGDMGARVHRGSPAGGLLSHRPSLLSPVANSWLRPWTWLRNNEFITDNNLTYVQLSEIKNIMYAAKTVYN